MGAKNLLEMEAKLYEYACPNRVCHCYYLSLVFQTSMVMFVASVDLIWNEGQLWAKFARVELCDS